MAGNPNTLIVLGSSPDSYFIGHGRRHFVENMPEVVHQPHQTDLNISMTLWISVSKTLDTWISHNTATAKFHFSGDINQDIRDHLSGTNGKARAEFVSFPDNEDSAHYFLKGKNDGAWSAVLQTYYIEKLTKMKAEILNFDAGDYWDDLWQGKKPIFSHSREHPLYKVLAQYEEGWCIERGSTLCFYDSRYFYLKFKRPGHSEIKMHWNLPSNMCEKLSALREQAEQPEEIMSASYLSIHWQDLTKICSINARRPGNNERQMNNMLCEQI
ncbi:hypothetical protein C8F04DRAFT_1151407 [Mycena alexandri]|uniref:Uncharacterized protein n=1 Tax=Mycena alexandri TaxID=1745969 RepID=A0AAD6S272_9AGAR|nr:hypothetical protein C8F04DRAFT_1151407 [Mycena alexandri]